uniref:Putative secreted protein n=1 Tax=Ixodes ricinus TaxID=34613 RepID=A0A6B0UK07_IXORI
MLFMLLLSVVCDAKITVGKSVQRRVLYVDNNYWVKQRYTTKQHTTCRFTIAKSLFHKELPVHDATQDDNFHDDDQDQNEFVGDHASVHGAQYLATRRQVLIGLFEPLFGPD